jgi:hypothetical protein
MGASITMRKGTNRLVNIRAAREDLAPTCHRNDRTNTVADHNNNIWP